MTMAGMLARSATEAPEGGREHSTSSTGTDTSARGAETTWTARGCISTKTETGDQSHREEFYKDNHNYIFKDLKESLTRVSSLEKVCSSSALLTSILESSAGGNWRGGAR